MASNRKIDRFERSTAVLFDQEYGKVEFSNWNNKVQTKLAIILANE